MTDLYVRCPNTDCRRSDGKPRHLVRLATRLDGGPWSAYEDPLDGVRVYACPTHGRFEVTKDGGLHKPRRRN